MTPMTEAEQSELLHALTELQPLRQTIGQLGASLRRTKPGTKKHREYWDRLTVLENQAVVYSSKIRMFLMTHPIEKRDE
jgi:hypothetical protein